MSGYCPDCGNTFCICDEETKLTYPLRLKILNFELKLAEAEEVIFFYSDEFLYGNGEHDYPVIFRDEGKRARQYLAKNSEVEDEDL